MAHDDAIGGDRLWAEAEFVEHARRAGSVVVEIAPARSYGNLG
jgi:hypothetical protein